MPCSHPIPFPWITQPNGESLPRTAPLTLGASQEAATRLAPESHCCGAQESGGAGLSHSIWWVPIHLSGSHSSLLGFAGQRAGGALHTSTPSSAVQPASPWISWAVCWKAATAWQLPGCLTNKPELRASVLAQRGKGKPSASLHSTKGKDSSFTASPLKAACQDVKPTHTQGHPQAFFCWKKVGVPAEPILL